MRVLAHILLSVAIGLPFYYIYGLIPFLLIFLSGVAIDIDHLFDFILWAKDRSIRAFLVQGVWLIKPHVSDTFFHSFELVFFLWIVISYFDLFQLLLPLMVGFTVHLLSDLIYNYQRYGTKPENYFLIFRFIRSKERLEKFRKHRSICDTVLQEKKKCEICHISEDLEVHMEKAAHGRLSQEQFIAVCPKCHSKKHVFFWRFFKHA